jgi:hypothetical protein
LPWFACSILVAACGFAGPWLSNGGRYWYLSIWIGLGWIIMVLAALIVLRWRALTLLVGAPLALYYPLVAYKVISACAQNINMCP